MVPGAGAALRVRPVRAMMGHDGAMTSEPDQRESADAEVSAVVSLWGGRFTDGPADAVGLELGGTGIGGGHDVSCGEGGAGFSGCLDHASMAVAEIMATVPPPPAVA